ncbi:hypothetical protein ACIQU5_20300 [Streptomyces sp. NPDC090306]|uniref:hypothetical protein n=1 Tax=unclassified Streptomyces TaxID=2593676 RepID=UPI0036E70C0D
MAARKSAKSTTPTPPPTVPCPVCKGSGDVPRTVLVGRKRRPAGQQSGFCLNCLGEGEVTS